ncbi:MAG: hypothetical protein DRP54_01280 [Spirochaetes bacterium]|nr:MAG: hypothetical protein DRP54_01280 [Spirochaetota bacterium]
MKGIQIRIIQILIIVVLFFIAGGLLYGGTGRDTMGNYVSIPDKDIRAVVLSPGAAEVLFSIGLDEEIVGVSDYCNWPPEKVKAKKKVGGFSTPNIEIISVLKPHVVVLTSVVPYNIKEQLESLGIKIFVSEPSSFVELIDSIVELGKLFNRKEDAYRIVSYMKDEVGKVQSLIRTNSLRPVKTMVEIWDNPLYVASPDTLPADIVRLAGGEIVPSDTSGFVRISEEVVIALKPEAMVLGHKISVDDFISAHKNLSIIPAMRNRKIIVPDPDEFLRPGPRVVNALKEIARYLHPEAFSE